MRGILLFIGKAIQTIDKIGKIWYIICSVILIRFYLLNISIQ